MSDPAGSLLLRKGSRQVRAMQLFYEVKRHFPSVPDHTITSKIDAHLHKNLPIEKLLEVMREIVKTKESMGKAHHKIDSPTLETIQVEEKVLGLPETREKPTNENVDKNKPNKRALNQNLNKNIDQIKENFCDSENKKKIEIDNKKCDVNNLDTKNNLGKVKEVSNKNVDEGVKFSVNETNQNINSNEFKNIVTKNMNEESQSENANICDNNKAIDTINTESDKKPTLAKRPNTLDFNSNKSKFKIQPSEKCTDVFTLLNSPSFNEKHPKALLSDKPPRSPLSARRSLRNSPVVAKKVSTPSQTTDTLVNLASANKVSTPCQTTDTLINNGVVGAFPPSVNVSINCEMVQSPKCSAKLEVTPAQPWLNPSSGWFQANSGDQSPRSFTSVNLTLRPPSSTPQDPIDITSGNSSMTYSTSSFDQQKGLQSRLQITVGPGGAQNVTSVRARPNSSYLPQNDKEEGATGGDLVPVKAGSMSNLDDISPEPPVLLKQQARIDKMRIELRTGYARLVVMRKEVEDLERQRREEELARQADLEVEKQLMLEVQHLKVQVEQLNKEQLNYTNPNVNDSGLVPSRPAPLPPLVPHRPAPPVLDFGTVPRRVTRGGLQNQGPPIMSFQEIDGPKWNCSMCTFLNHPSVDQCELCEMPRVLHGNNDNAAASLPPIIMRTNNTVGTVAETFNPLLSLPSTSTDNRGVRFNNINHNTAAEAINPMLLNLPGTSTGNRARNDVAGSNKRTKNIFSDGPGTSRTVNNNKPNILQSLLINTTSLVALKNMQSHETDLNMLQQSGEVLRNFRDQTESSSSSYNTNNNTKNNQRANFQNFAVNSTQV